MKKIILFILFISLNGNAKLRVVSLVPSTTDIIEQIGSKDLLVGVSQFCSTNKSLCLLPRLGTALSIDWEKLVTMKADLVFLDSYTKKKDLLNLDKLKIKYVIFPHDSIDDIKRSVLIVGKVLGALEKAKLILIEFEKKLNKYENKLANKKILIVLHETFSSKNISSAFIIGKSNFYNDLLKLSGAKNVATFSGYRKIDLETLYQYKPDYVICIREKQKNLIKLSLTKSWLKIYPKAKVYIKTSRDILIPSLKILSFFKEII